MPADSTSRSVGKHDRMLATILEGLVLVVGFVEPMYAYILYKYFKGVYTEKFIYTLKYILDSNRPLATQDLIFRIYFDFDH